MRNAFDVTAPPFNARVAEMQDAAEICDLTRQAMQATGWLETPAPPAALRWIATFVEAYRARFRTVADALPLVAALRAEAVTIPALQLEKLRNRQVLFFLDTVSQYVDDQPELRGIPVEYHMAEIAAEFGLSVTDALWAVRMALTASEDGPPLELLFPLLGHDRIMMRIGAVNSHILHGRGLVPIESGPGGQPFKPIQGVRPDGATG